MNKLQRYSAVTKTGVETVCLASDVAVLEAEIAKLKAGLSDAKLPRYQPAYNDSMREPVCLDSDVVVLEAENERLREVTMEREEQLKSLLHATVKFVENCAPDHIKQELYNGLEELNREQEKQP